jgi:hypothetical protein
MSLFVAGETTAFSVLLLGVLSGGCVSVASFVLIIGMGSVGPGVHCIGVQWQFDIQDLGPLLR